MHETPLVLVVGEDRLAEQVCAELTATTGHRVNVIWALSGEQREIFARLGVTVTPLAPDSDEALLAAGVADATSILTLSNDDGLNLSVALRARVLNPRIRLVLHLFDPILGRKLEQNLANCTVLSLAAHAASTFAGNALDPACLFAIRFRESDGPLVGFTQNTGAELGVNGLAVGEAEERLQKRIVAIGNHEDPPADAIVFADDPVVTFGRVREWRLPVPTTSSNHPFTQQPLRNSPTRSGILSAVARINPILKILITASAAFFFLSFLFFHFVLHNTWTEAAYYVVETMTNVGGGDVTVVTQRGPLVTLAAITAMLGGILFTSIFIGYVSSAVTRAQWTAVQGLRRIRARNHVVICGAGKVGTAVTNLLTSLGKRVVVVEPNPQPELVHRARQREVDLLTGDARGDSAFDLCDIEHASAFLALTNNDATNLEIALGARARVPAIPLVVRMEEPRFAFAAAQLLGISTFSPSALGAPAFAGLSRFPGTRGRVRYAGDDHTIGQRTQGEVPERPPARDCIALCVWRNNTMRLIRTFEEMRPYDVVLFSVPLAQFRLPETLKTTSFARDGIERSPSEKTV